MSHILTESYAQSRLLKREERPSRSINLWPEHFEMGSGIERERNQMTIKMTNREVDDVSVVTLDGRIVLGDESNSFREKLKSMIAEGKKKIVLNMADIKYIDSAGLGTLVAAHLSAKTQGASVRLCNLGKKFHEVMQITKLLTIFDVYDTEAAAISSFQRVLATSN
ncbi:MAG TPA: STAS domain-containing protein [Candidatus Dormibacteraeota bacterium]|jgi:anti-sigma B factor antagonist|nr:STAS domain-containing protein [Candidatus Dormibacteraeota bacterium]